MTTVPDPTLGHQTVSGVDWGRYHRVAGRRAARQAEVLGRVVADHRRRQHGPPRLADRAVGMPPRDRKDRT